MYKNCKRYKEDYLYKRLKDHDSAYRHIVVALNDSDNFIVLRCINNVIHARGGMKVLAKKMRCSSKDITSCLSHTRRLSVDILNKIFATYGFDIQLYPIDDIADYFIWVAQKNHIVITNLHIQKLCYFSEAFFLVTKGVPLTGELFQAWEYGPVSSVLWNRFKKTKGGDLRGMVTCKPDLEKNIEDHLETVIYQFCEITPWKLSRLTHEHTPWKDTTQNENIQKEDIVDFYKKYAKKWNREKYIFQ